jgi:hypothetical protein
VTTYAQIYAAFDVKRIGPISLTLTETGGGGATGAIDLSGHYVYTWYITAAAGYSGVEVFEVALKTALEAVGNATYSVSLNPVTLRVTISASGGGVTAFALSARSAAFDNATGFSGLISGALSYTATIAPYYVIDGAIGCVTDYTGWTPRERGQNLAKDLFAHDGQHYGVSQTSAPRLIEATFPLEPLSAIDDLWYDASTPWTWEKFFKHVRNIEPFVLYVTNTAIGDHQHICKLREDGAPYAPAPIGGEYFAVLDIPLRGLYLGRAE